MKKKIKKQVKSRRNKTQPQWKVTVLWVYLTVSIILTIWMICIYQFPVEKMITSGDSNYTCMMYKNSEYCCESYYWLLITDIDMYDNITGDKISVTDCFKLEKI